MRNRELTPVKNGQVIALMRKGSSRLQWHLLVAPGIGDWRFCGRER